jgi:pimeloyl-ACP methyl ester carboxylesterase
VPAVFVHGVPETPHVWYRVRSELDDVESIALQLPGFGAPPPDGFRATMDEYADWLIGEVDGIDGPVDLVGHDWGGILTVRVASLRPELLRSWVTDSIGPFDPDWEWHEAAKIWQTPGEGEEFSQAQLELPPEEIAPQFVAFGVASEDALAMARRVDQQMANCILSLYRSAISVNEVWGPQAADIPAPGMVLVPTEDPLSKIELAPRAATRAGAQLESLDGLGHWWPYQAPTRGADVLRNFWGSL